MKKHFLILIFIFPNILFAESFNLKCDLNITYKSSDSNMSEYWKKTIFISADDAKIKVDDMIFTNRPLDFKKYEWVKVDELYYKKTPDLIKYFYRIETEKHGRSIEGKISRISGEITQYENEHWDEDSLYDSPWKKFIESKGVCKKIDKAF